MKTEVSPCVASISAQPLPVALTRSLNWVGGAIVAITAHSTRPLVHLPQDVGLGQRGRGKRRH